MTNLLPERIIKRRAPLLVCLLYAIVLGGIIYQCILPSSFRSSSIPPVSVEKLNLRWQECELSRDDGPTSEESQKCFGHAAPMLGEAEKRALAASIEDKPVSLKIGNTVYTAQTNDWMFLTLYKLSRNGTGLYSLASIGDTLWLHTFLHNIDGRVAWEISNENLSTIVYDQRDWRERYNVDAAYRPYRLGDHIVWTARQGQKYFVMADGARIGSEFDRIIVAYCCETVLYSVQFGQGSYQLHGSRDGKNYLIEISTTENTRQAR